VGDRHDHEENAGTTPHAISKINLGGRHARTCT
jgi:hypothetical protein